MLRQFLGLITATLETGPLFSLRFNTVLDYHHTWLNLFESFERHQDELQSRNSLLALDAVPSPTFYIEAFFNGDLEWTEYAYSERELQNLKNDAIDSGCTFTVRLEDDED